MIVKMYAVLDSASGIYDGPVPAHTDGAAGVQGAVEAANTARSYATLQGEIDLLKERGNLTRNQTRALATLATEMEIN